MISNSDNIWGFVFCPDGYFFVEHPAVIKAGDMILDQVKRCWIMVDENSSLVNEEIVTEIVVRRVGQ